jgi:hypothetical protein
MPVLLRSALLRGLLLTLFCLPHATGCFATATNQGLTTQLDPDKDDGLGGTGVESGDIRMASEKIGRALASIHDKDGAPPRVALLPVQNLTRFRVDPALLGNRLTFELVKRGHGRYDIVPVGRAGDMRVSRTDAEYVLRTEMRGLTKDARHTNSDYIQYAFELERAKDGVIVWADQFETKRASSVDVIYQ